MSDGRDAYMDALELKVVAQEIDRRFPLVLDRSGLVLYEVAPEHLQLQWQISPDDLVRARRSFPEQSADVTLELRLQRLEPDGGPLEIASVTRTIGTDSLQGQVRFEVEDADALYQAELGLESPEGGWVLLARSNRARPPRRVNVDLAPRLPADKPMEGGGGAEVTRESSPASARFYNPRHALSSPALSGMQVAAADLELHAEVRIWGRAAPGTWVELFGTRLRADSNGHFALRRPIQDFALASRLMLATDKTADESETE
jgi:hypothetical protein